ncbi:hypothetical protein QEZ54_00740 [Catellatospora sp. KI3]|uniref:hypothetical protein n=1 Tax=Catellatospora sp. KI3 TaxID=3041620 RepID=UPI002483215B|nr:hypothetical protein [Catellatospora sp. KI3]MDI1459484.1 hypothetical protein [Catellatospora sp. KI3]
MSPLPLSPPRLSLSRLRWAATGLAGAALLLRIGHAVWWAPRLRGHSMIIQALPSVGIAMLVFGVAMLLLWPYRRPPRGFTATGLAFVGPASPAAGTAGILAAYLAGNFSDGLADVDGGLTADPGMWIAAGLLMTPFLAVGALLVWRGPRVVLDREGITVRRLRNRRIPWAALAPGGPDLPRGSERELWLSVLTGAGGHRLVPVTLNRLHVDGAFLAQTIRHYAEHPEHRAAIGTAAELDRLTAACPDSPTADTAAGLRDLGLRG